MPRGTEFLVKFRVMQQFLLLVLDLLCLPFLLLVLCTFYRFERVWKVMRKGVPEKWDSVDPDFLELHAVVLVNAAIVFHDCFFPFPLVALLLLLSHRRWALIDALIHASNRRKARHSETTPAAAAAAEDVAEALADGVEMAATDAGALDSAAPVVVVAAAPTPTALTAAPAVKAHFRTDMWRQGLELVIDFPFVLMGIIVLLTVWRADLVVTSLKSWPLLKSRADRAEFYQHPNRAWPFRKAVGWQFLKLFRDLPFIVPFALLLGTLYRFWPYFKKLLSRSSVFLETAPLLTVEAMSIQFDATASPTIAIRARKPQSTVVRAAEIRMLGPEFWSNVRSKLGGTVVTLAEGVQPMKLADKQNIDLDALNADSEIVDFSIKFVAPMKRTTLYKKLRLCERGGRGVNHVVLQVEGMVEGQSERQVLLCTILSVTDLVACANIEAVATLLPSAVGAYDAARVESVRGSTEDMPGVRDSMWLLTSLEFIELMQVQSNDPSNDLSNVPSNMFHRTICGRTSCTCCSLSSHLLRPGAQPLRSSPCANRGGAGMAGSCNSSGASFATSTMASATRRPRWMIISRHCSTVD